MQGTKDQACNIKLINAGEAAYPEGWENYQAKASYDRETWFQIPTKYVDGILSMDFTPEYDSILHCLFCSIFL